MRNRGQISFFVIIALLLVAVVILIFIIFRSPTISIGDDFRDPESFIDKCLRQNLRETIDVMMPQGGFISPGDHIIYNNIKVPYLCKNVNYYEPCVTQYPRYITRLQEELENGLREGTEQCFFLLENELEKRNYAYSGEDFFLDVVLKPEIVEVVVFRNFSLRKGDFSRDFGSFAVSLKNPLYDLGYVANEIASQESKFCYFEYVGFNALYNKFDVRKFTMSDSTKIYTIKYKETGDEMNVATRGCVIPGGF
jgi:hypothetical protein